MCVLCIIADDVSLNCCYASNDKPAEGGTCLIPGYSAQTDGILVAFKFQID